MSKQGYTIWFTGLSGSGKSTLAQELKRILETFDHDVYILDGDTTRGLYAKKLGFSKDDRDEQVRRIGSISACLSQTDAVVIAALISPYEEAREKLRIQNPDSFFLVYCDCDMSTLIKRDPKGLYERALAGKIKNFTGVSDPYEPPINPDVIVNTGIETVETSIKKILDALEVRKLINNKDSDG